MTYLYLFIIIISFINILWKRKQYILVLLFIELIFISISILFLFSSLYLDDIEGLIFSLVILIVAATESAIGLSLIIVFYRYLKI